MILCVGTGQQNEGEGNDRDSMNLPNNQQNLFDDVVNHATSKYNLKI